MVRVRLVHHEDVATRGGIRPVAFHREPGDVRVAVRVGVVHVELVAPWCEGEPQEPLLTSEGHVVGEIDHRHLVDGPPGADRHDLPRLLRHVERGVARPDRHRERLLERRHLHQSDPHVGELDGGEDGAPDEDGVVVEDAALGEGLGVSDGVPAFPQAPTNRTAVIASVDVKRLEGVTSRWYEPQCGTVPRSRRLRADAMAATTTSIRPIPHITGADDLGGTGAGTTRCSIAASRRVSVDHRPGVRGDRLRGTVGLAVPDHDGPDHAGVVRAHVRVDAGADEPVG